MLFIALRTNGFACVYNAFGSSNHTFVGFDSTPGFSNDKLSGVCKGVELASIYMYLQYPAGICSTLEPLIFEFVHLGLQIAGFSFTFSGMTLQRLRHS